MSDKSSSSIKAGNYKAYNIIHKVNYWKSMGEDPDFLFAGLDLDYREIKETDWLDYETQVKVIWDNERQKVPNPRDHETLGYMAYLNQSMGAMEVFAKLVDLNTIFKQFVRLSHQYSLVEFYAIHNLERNRAALIYCPKKPFFDDFGFASLCFVAGFLKAMPKIFEPSFATAGETVEDACVEISMSCFGLRNILLRDFAYLIGDNMGIREQDGMWLIDGEVYGRRIPLAVEGETQGFWRNAVKSLKRHRSGEATCTMPHMKAMN